MVCPSYKRPQFVGNLLSCLIATLYLFLPTNGSAQDKKDMRIAIVGAGASGLTAADTLLRKGYKNVTVFEKNEQVGGKVFSRQQDGHVYELGAFWGGSGYKVTYELAERYGVEFVSEDLDFKVRMSENGPEYGLAEYLTKNFNPLEVATGFYRWMQVQNKYGYLKEAGAFFQPMDQDLTLPFSEFVKLYKIEAFAQSFRPFWIGCGYGYYEEVPALYVLKLMLGALEFSVTEFIGALLPFGNGNSTGLSRAPDGFQSLWVKVASAIPDLRLSTPVQQVVRYQVDGVNQIDVLADDTWSTFDALIISTAPSTALKFLDSSEDEKSLFSQVRHYRYITQMFTTENMPYSDSTMIFSDDNGTLDRSGHPTAIVNRSFAPNLWISGQLVPWGMNLKTTHELLSDQIRSFGGNVDKFLETAEWNYFPHVSSKQLQDGFYEKLGNFQGYKNTWYVGGILNFESVESTASYAKKLVEDHF